MANASAESTAYQGFRLDGITVEPNQGRLLRPDGPVSISPKAMDVLLTLAQANGNTVSFGELLERTWGSADHNHGVLIHAIGELRQALQDSPHCPRFIQTIRGQGYRLRMPVRYGEAAPAHMEGATDLLPVPQHVDSADDRPRFFRSSTMLRLTATYAVGSWVLIQVMELLLPLFNVADWVLKLVLLVLITGYPVVVLVAWFRAYRGGQVAEPATTRKERWTRLAVDLSILGVMTLCVGALSTWLTSTVMKESEMHSAIVQPENETSIPRAKVNHQSVLVVPFKSATPTVVPDYFLGVVHDELLQSMTTNPGLSPISLRAAASVRPEETLSDLRQRLGVRWVVDGRLSSGSGPGDVVVTMALSDTLSSEMVWNGKIEGSSNDLLALQSRMQRRLLAALTLWVPGAGESGSPEVKTSSVEAFEAFLQGVALERTDPSPSNLDASIRFLQKARQLDPGFRDAAAHLCKVYVRRFERSLDLDDFAQARANCDLVAGGDAGDMLAGLSMARLYLTAGRLDEAQALLQRLAMNRPKYPELLVLKARLASARGDHALSGVIFREAIAAEPGFAGNYHDYGVALFQQGDFDGAFEQFSKELMLQPEAPGSWNSLGAIFFYKGQYADAENAYRRSVELEPTAGNYSNLAALYFARRRFAEAASAFRHAISLNPADPRMWLNWGDALYYMPGSEQQKDAAYAQAALLLRRGLALHPGDLDKSSMLMHAEAARGQCQRALAVLRNVSPDAAWTHDTAYFRAIVHMRCSEPATAEEAINQLVALGYPPQALLQDIQFDAYRALISGTMSEPEQREGK